MMHPDMFILGMLCGSIVTLILYRKEIRGKKPRAEVEGETKP